MSRIAVEAESETTSDHLPPVIDPNPRPKIVAVQIPVDEIKVKHEEKPEHHHRQERYHVKPPPVPTPIYSLAISWTPEYLHFDLFEEPVVIKLVVWNCCTRAIYLQCCGLWNDTSRLGASWRSYPRKRFWLAPGLTANLYVRAQPRPAAPLPFTYSTLQIAATHLRDNVIGYFAVPIKANFLKYEPPHLNTGE